MSDATTRGVRVQVLCAFIPQQSEPEEAMYFFAYRVTITNQGPDTVTLRSRHWVITDGNGRVEEVRGPGVVGEQPHLAPGQAFTYTSGCPLATPVGSMYGTFQMVTDGGEGFDATIAPFTLAMPGVLQ